MNLQIEQIKEFQTAFGLGIKPNPEFPVDDKRLIGLRDRLIKEEVEELLEAERQEDLVEIADAITDCLYVLLGTACEYGLIDLLPELFTEVHNSNMSKLGEDGKPLYRHDGKVMKGPKFFQPDLKSIIYGQV